VTPKTIIAAMHPVGIKNSKSSEPLAVFKTAPDSPQFWIQAEISAVQRELSQVARATADQINASITRLRIRCRASAESCADTPYMTETEAFYSVFGGPISVYRSSLAHNWGAEVKNISEIYVYNLTTINPGVIEKGYLIENPRIIGHEMGHVYGNIVKQNLNVDPFSALSVQLLRLSYGSPTDSGRFFGFYGGWESWQFGSPAFSPTETFADMYLAWVYNHWDANALGTYRQNWMQNRIRMWTWDLIH